METIKKLTLKQCKQRVSFMLENGKERININDASIEWDNGFADYLMNTFFYTNHESYFCAFLKRPNKKHQN